MNILISVIYTAIIAFLANSYALSSFLPVPAVLLGMIILAFLWIQFVPAYGLRKIHTMRLRVCQSGCQLLLLFIFSTVITVVFSVIGFVGGLPVGGIWERPFFWIAHSLIAFLVEAIVFWNGMIRVYATSVQLGIKLRVLGALLGLIPIAHLIMLGIIIHKARKEVKVEEAKIRLDEERRQEQICHTKYPILLVHGVFFRDTRYMNYWGRIPKELETNGARVYYGNQPSALSVADSARYLAGRIEEILAETGAEKINIIAHSKGGLDSRYAISKLGIADKVASLTTINTPHRGCEFAEYLLEKIPKSQQDAIANTYNRTLQRLGDPQTDFMAAVRDLTSSACCELNRQVEDAPNVYYQSVGSQMNVPRGGRFPLNFTSRLVARFDGPNDGLVGEDSFIWGDRYENLTVKGTRGISHGDMIDLNRENYDAFDVREYYVLLVSELREHGF